MSKVFILYSNQKPSYSESSPTSGGNSVRCPSTAVQGLILQASSTEADIPITMAIAATTLTLSDTNKKAFSSLLSAPSLLCEHPIQISGKRMPEV